MTFADYKGIWEITSVDEKVAETVGHWIVIGGIPSAVKILCLDGVHKGHAFAAYSYNESNECLVSSDSLSRITLELSTNGSSNKIIWQGPLLPGSWTAEDNPGGRGGDKTK